MAGATTAPAVADPTPTTSQAPASDPVVAAQVNLRAVDPNSPAFGVANVVAQAGQRALAVIAQELPPGKRYAVWVGDRFLGFVPPVVGEGDARGRLPPTPSSP